MKNFDSEGVKISFFLFPGLDNSCNSQHKNKLQLCLDSTNDFLGDKIGESARKNAFDFSSDKISVLKSRIIDLVK